jgi:HK97 family phage major capsid protein
MNLHEKRKAELAAAQGIIDRAKSEGRNMTDAERAEVTLRLKTAGELLAAITSEANDKALREQIGAAMKDDDPTVDDGSGQPKGKRYRSVGEAFVKSDAYIDAIAALASRSRFTTRAVDTGLDLKSLTTTGTVYPGGHQDLPGIVTKALQRPTVADLLASGTVTGSVLSYLVESAYTNAAAAVAEGGAKPASDLTLTRVDQVLSKIATLLDVPDEFLQDADAARSYIDGRLTLFIQLAEEQQLISGSGTAPNLRGILNTSGIQTETQAAAPDTGLDALYRAITKVRTVAFLEPDGVVINPADYQALRLAKDANDQYYGGGPFTGAYGAGGGVNDPGVWGLRTVVTTAVAAKTAIVGSWQAGAMVFRKGGITVDSTNSDADKFTKNITTIRAEERLALAVFRPSAFVKVTLL